MPSRGVSLPRVYRAGFVSMVLARVARRVLATDNHVPSLRLCQHNAQANAHLFHYGVDVMRPRLLDWAQPPPELGPGGAQHRRGRVADQLFSWRPEDVRDWSRARLLFARCEQGDATVHCLW